MSFVSSWPSFQFQFCLDPISMSFVSSRPSFQFATTCNSLFTPPTWTRHNCLVLWHWRCEHNCRQDQTVLSCPCLRCEQSISCKLKTGSRQEKTVLSGVRTQLVTRQDQTVLSRWCRWCEQVMRWLTVIRSRLSTWSAYWSSWHHNRWCTSMITDWQMFPVSTATMQNINEIHSTVSDSNELKLCMCIEESADSAQKTTHYRVYGSKRDVTTSWAINSHLF